MTAAPDVIDHAAVYRLLTVGDPADMRGMSPASLVQYDRLLTGADRPPRPLRRWQGEAMPRALAALEAQIPGVVVATTGAGKSVFLAELLRRWRAEHPDDMIVVTTPSVQLVDQLGATLAEWLGPGIVGRYYTKAKQHKRPVVVACNASVVALAAVLREHGRRVSVWIADECHKTASEAFGADVVEPADEGIDVPSVADVLTSGRRLGLTATPFRSDETERLGLFSAVVYRYTPADAQRDGVIVPWRFVAAEEEGLDVDAACIAMIHALGCREHRGPGVVDARSIEDAESYVATLGEGGIVARAIHSRQPDGDRAAALAALRDGQIDCVVHVAMLVEGVDLPWLRWGCFRRPVGARVRYIQHLGRYLRAAPGKTEAVILDPCGLEQRFRVTYEEALGWAPPVEAAAGPVEDEDEEEDPLAEAPDREPQIVLTARVNALARYVRQLTGALVAEGVTDRPDRRAGGWRHDEPSQKQVAALTKMVRVAARLGPAHRAALGKLAVSPVLTRGLASDVFDLLLGVQKLPGGEVWTPCVPVQIPPDHAYQVPASAVIVGAALAGGRAAVAVLRDGEVVYAGARPATPADTVESLTTRAEALARERCPGRIEIRRGEAASAIALARCNGPQ